MKSYIEQSSPRSGERVSSFATLLRGLRPTVYASMRTARGIEASCSGKEQPKLHPISIPLARCGNPSRIGKPHHSKQPNKSPRNRTMQSIHSLNAIPNANPMHFLKIDTMILMILPTYYYRFTWNLGFFRIRSPYM